MINARRSPRIRCWMNATLSRLGGDTLAATVADMSEHGVFVQTDVPLEPGSLELFKINLPGDGSIDLFGVVRFVGPTANGMGAGVAFFFTPEKKERWASHYHALAQRERAQAA